MASPPPRQQQLLDYPIELAPCFQPPPPAKFKFILAITSCLVSAGNQTGSGCDPPEVLDGPLGLSSFFPPQGGCLPGAGPQDGGGVG